ncbi:MAG TPA: GerAB/ArcD/ProY family transporter, partial [Bacillales bacterium]|nr:GerAB/ArcD/ProY family transporter [Bacillales bacterium]
MADLHSVKESKKISPYMVMFVIHPLQIGVGILSFQHDIVKYAGYDAWISVILAGLGTHALLWIIYSILNKGKGDLIKIHRDMFGKWVGGAF